MNQMILPQPQRLDDRTKKAVDEIDRRIQSYGEWRRSIHPYAKGNTPGGTASLLAIRSWTKDVINNLRIIRDILTKEDV